MNGSTPNATARLEALFDPGTFAGLDGQAKAGVACGYGAVAGAPVCAFAQDGAGMGAAEAKKLGRLYDLALKTGVPVVGLFDSPGAKLDEGVGALEAYSEILGRVNRLSGVVPQISVVLGTCAGCAAMMACSADLVVLESAAALFLTPPGLAGDAEGASGSADDAALAGVAHILAEGEEAALRAARGLLALLPSNNLAAPPVLEFSEPDSALRSETCDFDDIAGDVLADSICDGGSAVELLGAFGSAAYTALATLGGSPVGIAAACGRLDADDCSKIARLVQLCDAYQIPVVTLVNAAGFAAQGGGAVRETAKLAHFYAEATTPKVAVITGKAYGAAYVALAGSGAGADYTFAWPGAVISPLDPTATVAFLYGERITLDRPREEVERGYAQNEASAQAAAGAGYIGEVVEPAGTRARLLPLLELLAAKRVSRQPKKHSNLPV